ncbi:MAG TPA: discoidin domain-containing protein [Polyangiaceae bacterium]|nr:discoidin domain-containing protein [Polyangiaceae bacterium]
MATQPSAQIKAAAAARGVLAALPTAFIVSLVLAVYGGSISWAFTSEDWCHALRDPTTVFQVGTDSAARYSPLGWAYLALVPGPLGLRLCALGLLCMNVILLGVLGRRLGLSAQAAWLARVFYAFYPYHYESVFWVTASGFYLTLTTCVLSALLLLENALRRASAASAALAAILGILGMLFHEQGTAILALALLLPMPRGLGGHLRRRVLVVWVLAALGLFGLKLWAHLTLGQHLGIVPASGAPVLANLAATLLHGFPATVFAGLSTQNVLGQSAPLALGVAIFGVATLALAPLPGSTRRLLWCYLFAAAPTFLFVDTIAPRYLCLPAVFLALAWGNVLSHCFRRASRSSRVAQVAAGVTLVALNFEYLQQRRLEWSYTARVYQDGVDTPVRDARKLPPRAEPYQIKTLDFPARYPEGAFSPAFVFRMCYPLAVERALADAEPPVVAELSMVRTRGCAECWLDAPAVLGMPAGDLCYRFDQASGKPLRADCGAPDHSFEFSAAQASAFVEQGINENYSPAKAVDGRLNTEWLATTGNWLDVHLAERQAVTRVRLINSVNKPYNDHATYEFVLRLFDGEQQVAETRDRFLGFSLEPGWHDVALAAPTATRVRFEILSHFGAGGGIAEMQVQ